MGCSRKCSIPGCGSKSYYKNRWDEAFESALSFFSIPKKAEQLEKWKEVLGENTIDYSNSSLIICERHFRPEDVLKNITVDYGNVVETLGRRHRVCLRTNAVPISVTPLIIETETVNNEKKTKMNTVSEAKAQPMEIISYTRIHDSKKNNEPIFVSIESLKPKSSLKISENSENSRYETDICNMPIVEEEHVTNISLDDASDCNINKPEISGFGFEIHEIRLPSDLWSSCVTKNNFMFMKWREDLSSTILHVILSPSLKLEVFTHGIVVSLSQDHFPSPTSVANVNDILEKINNIMPCPGFEIDDCVTRSPNCIGFLHSRCAGKREHRCIRCTIAVNKNKKEEKRRKESNDKLRLQLVNERVWRCHFEGHAKILAKKLSISTGQLENVPMKPSGIRKKKQAKKSSVDNMES